VIRFDRLGLSRSKLLRFLVDAVEAVCGKLRPVRCETALAVVASSWAIEGSAAHDHRRTTFTWKHSAWADLHVPRGWLAFQPGSLPCGLPLRRRLPARRSAFVYMAQVGRD